MPNDSPLDDDLYLGGDNVASERVRHVEFAPSMFTLLAPPASGFLTWGHGFTVRFRVVAKRDEVVASLSRIGWTPSGSPSWTTIRTTPSNYQRMNGSASLSHTAPGTGRKKYRKRNRDLYEMNKRVKVRLYDVGIDLTPHELFIELSGVQWRDVDRFLMHVLDLPAGSYEIVHLLNAERYIVLSAADAERVAESYGTAPRSGGGAYVRKAFLVKDVGISVPIRRRAKTEALLTLYRITLGSTYVFKMEARLRGRRRDRQQFGLHDVGVLDDILLEHVERLQLVPLAKPARWEPRDRRSLADSGPLDATIRRLPEKATRGRAMIARLVRELANCHTLEPDGQHGTRGEVAADRSVPPRIMSSSSSLSQSPSFRVIHESHPMEPRWFVPDDEPRSLEQLLARPQEAPTSPEDAIARELNLLPGALVEIVLSPDENPTSYVEAIINSRKGRRVGVSLLGTHTWGALERGPLQDHALNEDADDVVLIVDPSAIGGTDAVCSWDDEAIEMRPGPLADRHDLAAAESTALAAMLWNSLRACRAACESENALIVVVTIDHRPPSRYGTQRRSWFFTDARVRSLIGDAGRYLCHVRYRVGHGGRRVVTIKDEAEGLPGRILWPSST